MGTACQKEKWVQKSERATYRGLLSGSAFGQAESLTAANVERAMGEWVSHFQYKSGKWTDFGKKGLSLKK